MSRHNHSWLRNDITYCLSTSRPPTPYFGENILEVDTGNILYWYGAQYGWCPNWNDAWGKLVVAVQTSDVVIYPSGDVGTATFNAVKNRHYKYSFYAPGKDVNASSTQLILVDGTNTVVNGYTGPFISTAAVVGPICTIFEEPYTAASASITRKCRASVGTASGTHGMNAKMVWVVEDMGPVAAPT